MTPPAFRRRPLVLLAAALLAGCGKAPAPPDAPPAAPVAWQGPLDVAPEEWVELVGATQPLPDAVGRVTTPIDGRIASLLVYQDEKGNAVQLHEGDLIKQGTPIIRLDDRIARLNLDKAKSAAAGAWQEVAQAQTALRLASFKFTTLKALREKTPTSVPEIDLKTAEGAEQDALSKLQAAFQRRDQAREDLETVQTQLGLCTLTAPISGRLGRVQAAIGQTLTAGAEAAQIINIEDKIDVLCLVSQHDAAQLQVDQPANLGGFDERPGEVRTTDLDGVVAYVSDKAEPESGCFVVKVRFPNKNPHLRGSVVQRVRIRTREGEQQPSLQEDWLIEDRDPPSVVVVEDVKTRKNEDGKDEETGTARRLSALIGVRDREAKLVGLRGLVDADGKKYTGPLDKVLFVTQGAQGLETGDAVRLQMKEED